MFLLRKIIYIAVIIALSSGTITAQQSDYQVAQQFKQSVQELEEQILNAGSTQELNNISEQLDTLQLKYTERRELLDHALYPDSFSEVVRELSREIQSNEQKLLAIERQREEITSLSDKINIYRNEIAFINSRTDSLRNVIAQAQKDRKNLSSAIVQYRNELERRDELILKMVDSLFVTVNSYDGQVYTEIEESLRKRTLSGQEHPLNYLSVLIEKNISTLKHHQDNLTVRDYLRMYAVQQRFEQVWDKIGNDLSKFYGEENAAELKSTIDAKVQDWDASASRNMWASLDVYLEDSNINLPAFDNNSSFFAALEAFIDGEVHSSRDKIFKNVFHKEFQAFYEIWNSKIKDDWGEFVKDGEVLTMNQISTIDAEIMHWENEVEPRSFTIPIMLGLSLMAIVGLIIALARKE
ncbi:MAG: hypothetical protein RI564_04955 [Gracilimonas sp.]|nr:hypothetical protein [Gracilimonas sp.]